MPASRFVKKEGHEIEIVPKSNGSRVGACPFKQGWQCGKTMPEDLSIDQLYLFCIACQLAQVTTELYKMR